MNKEIKFIGITYNKVGSVSILFIKRFNFVIFAKVGNKYDFFCFAKGGLNG